MNKNKYTKLEEQMQRAFDMETVSNQAWNAPDDGMFFSALEEIEANRQEDQRPGAIFLSGILIFSLLLLLIAHTTFNTLDPVSSALLQQGNLTEQAAELQSEDVAEIGNVLQVDNRNQTKSADLNQGDGKSDDQRTISIIDRHEALAIQGSKELKGGVRNNGSNLPFENSKIITQTTSDNLLNAQGITVYQDRTIVATSASSSPIFNSQLLEDEVIETRSGSIASEYVTVVALDAVGLRSIAIDNPATIDHDIDLSTLHQTLEKSNSRSHFAVVARSGINFNSFVMPGTIGDQLQGYTNWSPGVFIDLGVQQSLTSRFSISYDLGYSKVKSTSRQFDVMIYDKDNETTDAYGNNVYNCDIEVNSPTTRFICNMDLVLDEDMVDLESMNSVTEIIQNYEVARLAVRPQYDIYSNSRLKVTAGMGISANYITRFEQNMDFKLFHNSYIMTRESMTDNDADKLNRFFAAASVNSGVFYQVSNRWDVGLQASYGRSINSLSRTNRTLLRDIRLGLVAGYSF